MGELELKKIKNKWQQPLYYTAKLYFSIKKNSEKKKKFTGQPTILTPFKICSFFLQFSGCHYF